MAQQFLCPHAEAWDRVYRVLLGAWEERGDPLAPKPPVPLILAGWAFTDDVAKKRRWEETVQWASAQGVSRLIPRFEQGEVYFGSQT